MKKTQKEPKTKKPKKTTKEEIEVQEEQKEPQFMVQIHEYSYSNINNKVDEKEKELVLDNKEGYVKTRHNDKVEEHKLGKDEIHEICEAFLSSGLPCPHRAKYLTQSGGSVCGHHR